MIAQPTKEVNWQDLHSEILSKRGPVEIFPIDAGNGKYYLGLNIPQSKFNEQNDVWFPMQKIIKILIGEYQFKVFDLYGGFYVSRSNLDRVKNQLYGK